MKKTPVAVFMLISALTSMTLAQVIRVMRRLDKVCMSNNVSVAMGPNWMETDRTTKI